jgi:hypothetical protein
MGCGTGISKFKYSNAIISSFGYGSVVDGCSPLEFNLAPFWANPILVKNTIAMIVAFFS